MRTTHCITHRITPCNTPCNTPCTTQGSEELQERLIEAFGTVSGTLNVKSINDPINKKKRKEMYHHFFENSGVHSAQFPVLECGVEKRPEKEGGGEIALYFF